MRSSRGWALGAASALLAGALLLAPPVVRYWGARLGAGQPVREGEAAHALKPSALDGVDRGGASDRDDASDQHDDVERLPRAATRSNAPRLGRPAPALASEAESASEEPELEPELGAEAELAGAEEVSAAGVPHPPAPARHRTEEHDPRFEPEGTAPEPSDEPPPAGHPPEPAPTRRISITVLEARTQPGLCKGSSAAADARALLVARFHALSWDGASTLYLDPRLAPGADAALVADLEHAERELARVLRLTPPRPDVFAYYDTRLLLAGGCTNDNVVAYYDGALHVVPSHDDVAQSILHEYTHHALTAAGLLGPAWAQEGIAMHIAGETWWRGGWMQRVLERPFSLEDMDSAVPYTLTADHAGLFYAQSAAMVECAIQDDPDGLAGLVASLAAGNDRSELSYELPPAAAPAAWRSCFGELAR